MTISDAITTRAREIRFLSRKQDFLYIALTIPTLCLFAVLFLYPILQLMARSVETGSLEWYTKALSDGLYVQVFIRTLVIGLAVTFVTFLMSYPLAYFLATTNKVLAAIGFAIVVFPIWTSVLVRTYAWMVLLGNNGVLNKLLLYAGIIDEPLRLIYNESGVIIGLVHLMIPYMVLPIYSAMMRLDPNLIAAAEGLGAPAWRILLRVYLPLTTHGIFAGSVLVFMLSIGAFTTPAVLGGGRVSMIAVLIEQQVRELMNWPFAAALSMILLIGALAIYALTQRFTQEREAR